MKEDRRVNKTKKALYTSLLKLLKSEQLHSITIQKLCDDADIHRATFYYHYADIYQLYNELEEQYLDELSNLMIADEQHDYTVVYKNTVEYIFNNADQWLVLFKGNGNHDFREKISNMFEERLINIWQYETGQQHFPLEFYQLISFEAGGIITLIIRCLIIKITCPFHP